MKTNWTICVATTILLCANQSSPGQSNVAPSLFPGRCYSTGDTSAQFGRPDFVTADVDGDTFIDIISLEAGLVESNSNLLTVWKNNGNRLFEPTLSIPIPKFSNLVGVGNFNGDNIRDFVLLPESDSDLENIFWIVSSLDDSTFVVSEPMELPLSNAATVEIGDFNNDGLDDLLFAATFFDAVAMINNGVNQFSLQTEFDINFDFGSEPVICDIDFDSDLDIVFPTISGNEIYLNDGDASFFSNGISVGVSGNIVVGDLNSDNFPDLVVSADNQIFVFVNNQNLQFIQSDFIDAQTLNTFIELADVDGDNDSDIVFGKRRYVGS